MSRSYSYFNGKEMKWVPDSNALYQDLLNKVREVFGIQKFENGGLTEMETMNLLEHFLIYKGK